MLSTFSNIFCSETTGPIETKFHVEPPWDGERKFVQTVLVTWPRWPPCPYVVKTLKIFFSGTKRPMTLVCSIRCSSATKFFRMMTLGWLWPILQQGQIWSLMLLYGQKVKQWIFSDTIVVYDLKLATDDWSDKKFLLTSKLCPLGAACFLRRGYIRGVIDKFVSFFHRIIIYGWIYIIFCHNQQQSVVNRKKTLKCKVWQTWCQHDIDDVIRWPRRRENARR